MSERWLPIENYSRYEISDFGNVRNVISGRILKASRDARGYLTVKLYYPAKTHAVHLLVARAFLGLCPDGQECRHYDGNPGNPVLTNLLYGTRAQNRADAYRHGTCSPEKDLLVGRKTRDTKDARYGRKWAAFMRAGIPYSRMYDL